MAFKVTKNYGKYSIVKDDWLEKWLIVDVESGQSVYGGYHLGSLKSTAEALESGAKLASDFDWSYDYGNPIDMPKSLKAKQAQMQKQAQAQAASEASGVAKPTGSHAPSIVEVTDKGAYKITKMSDGTYGVLVPSTGESKMGFASKQGASMSGSHSAKKHAASILSGQGVDPGSNAVDTLIDLYEGRVREMYGRAYREMTAKQASFMERFHGQQAEMIAKHDAGEITQAELKRWYEGQAVMAQRNTQMVNALADDLSKADKHAMAMLNGYMVPAYSENLAYATYQIEKAAKVSTSFSLYNRNAVANILKDPDKALLPTVDDAADLAWCRKKISSCIAQSILQGDSVPAAAARLESVVGMGANSAVRAARTALTGAQNLGRLDAGERAREMGIELMKQWVSTADDRTRDSHVALDRETVELDESFSNGCDYPGDPSGDPSEVYNCFIGETKAIPLGGIERSFKRWYDGDVVTVETASGVKFTCTPNHPIMTSEGWTAAGALRDGDHLLIAKVGDELASGWNPDVQHVSASMEAIHELAAEFPSERACGLSVYFHEDVPARDVDVITEKRVLRVNLETSRLEPFSEITFESADALTPRHSAEGEFVCASATAPDGVVGGFSEPRALIRGSVRHSLEHGLRTVPGGYSAPFEPEIYNTSTDAELLCDSLDGLSAVVKFDDVVSIDIRSISDHVYNLQTESGAYLAGTGNGSVFVVSHNCRCAMRFVLPGHEYDDIPETTREGQDYEEWKAAHTIDEEAEKEKLQGQLDAIEAQKADIMSALPPDETYDANDVLKHDASLSNWENEQQAIADSKAYTQKKLDEAWEHYVDEGEFESKFWEDKAVHYQAKLDAIYEYDEKGKAYFEAKQAVQDQLDALDAQRKEIGAKLAEYNKGAGPYSPERLAAGRKFAEREDADDALRAISGKAWREATMDERRAINTYTGGDYDEYNIPLNGFSGSYRNFVGMDDVDIDDLGRGKDIRDMTRIIERSKMDEDTWVRRGVGTRTMNDFFGVDIQADITALPDEQLKSFVGVSNRIGSFQSCGTTFDTGFTHKPVSLEIFVPKGAEAMYVEPISICGNGAGLRWDGIAPQHSLGGELETILQRGGSYTCVDFKRVGGKPTFVLELHPEDGYWKFQQ